MGGSSCRTHRAGVSAEAAGGGQKELNCSVQGQWAGVFVQATKVEKVRKQEIHQNTEAQAGKMPEGLFRPRNIKCSILITVV